MGTSIVVLLSFAALIPAVFLLAIVILLVSVAAWKLLTSLLETVQGFWLQRRQPEMKRGKMISLGKKVGISKVSRREENVMLEFKPNNYCTLSNAVTIVHSDFTPTGGRIQISFEQALHLMEALDEKMELPVDYHPKTYEESLSESLPRPVLGPGTEQKQDKPGIVSDPVLL